MKTKIGQLMKHLYKVTLLENCYFIKQHTLNCHDFFISESIVIKHTQIVLQNLQYLENPIVKIAFKLVTLSLRLVSTNTDKLKNSKNPCFGFYHINKCR